MSEINFIYCDYEENKPESFTGFSLKLGDTTIRFENKDPIFAYKILLTYLQNLEVSAMVSSSVDNYIIDSKNEELGDLVYQKAD